MEGASPPDNNGLTASALNETIEGTTEGTPGGVGQADRRRRALFQPPAVTTVDGEDDSSDEEVPPTSHRASLFGDFMDPKASDDTEPEGGAAEAAVLGSPLREPSELHHEPMASPIKRNIPNLEKMEKKFDGGYDSEFGFQFNSGFNSDAVSIPTALSL